MYIYALCRSLRGMVTVSATGDVGMHPLSAVSPVVLATGGGQCHSEQVIAHETYGLPADRLLGRLLGHLSARCLHCGQVQRVEDMPTHLRACPPGQVAVLRSGHVWANIGTSLSVCLGRGECVLPEPCNWTAVVLRLLAVDTPLARDYLRQWLGDVAAASPDSYMLTHQFRGLVEQAAGVVASTWDTHWDAQAPRRPGSLEVIRMYDCLEATEHAPIVLRHVGQLGRTPARDPAGAVDRGRPSVLSAGFGVFL